MLKRPERFLSRHNSPFSPGRRDWTARVLLAGLAAFFLLLPGRAGIPPFDRDEPRYMEATSQMLKSGNFVDVRFQDKPRYLQPAGIYWLESLSVAAAGRENRYKVWPYRVPSLLAMSIVTMLTALAGGILFSRRAGLLAAGIFATSVLVMAEGRMATIDSMLLLTVVAAQYLLMKVLQDRESGRATSTFTAAGWWLAAGCGLMLKGPVVLIPLFGTVLMLWAVERDRSWWGRLRPRWGWLVMLAVVLPWCVAIGVMTHGEFFRLAIGHNLLGKIGSGQEAHGLPPGYHILVFLITFWPGSFFAVRTLPWILSERRSLQVRFLLCWIVPHWLVFELIATKLPHYVLPVWPALALLVAAALTDSEKRGLRLPWPMGWRILFSVYGVLWTIVSIALCCSGAVLSQVLEHHVPPEAWIMAAGSLPLLVLTLRSVLQGRLWQGAVSAMGMAVIVYVGLFFSVIPGLKTIWMAPRLAELVDEYRPCTETKVVSVSFSEPSLVFLMHGDVLLRGVPEAADIMKSDRSCTLVLADRRDEDALREALASSGIHPVEFGRVQGINYSNGRHLDIGLLGYTGQ
ncbi:glycosyltransferase family 39 protein [Acetobacter sp. AN02]|uniref:ArnT family glycosyltransferase n=1 Tax=Acetobacter sp. AN02 TaxID=2894186 RepID=UPI002434140E|nr:glycosyltransferase family 39 protein [Acetobacter sp. AN02]MDG6093826.1 glycosyltransferase family 39 protein [Acetobacter sp. AN02]